MITQNFDIFTFKSKEGYKVVEKEHLGKTYLVVPVTMMVEGVHSGSHGPLLHTIEELGKFPLSWNGIPIVVDHPADEEGNGISANEPEVIDNEKIGIVYHTCVKGKKLKAEAWLDKEKLTNNAPDILSALNEGKTIEVSVGVFTDEEETPGDWNGEQYNAIARNHRPDHLALLPGGTGACSAKDGCGIRANSKKERSKNEMIKTNNINKLIQTCKQYGLALQDVLDNTTDGLIERLDAVRNKVYSLDTNDSYHLLHEVYDDHVIYESRMRVGESKIYKQNYSFNSGNVELTGDPVEVHKKVEYVNVNSATPSFVRTKPIKIKEETNMTENKCPKCVEKINALIANSASGFVENDREFLNGLNENQLDKLTPKAEKPAATPAATPAVQTLSAEQLEDLAWARRERAAKKNGLIAGIQANTSKEEWPESELTIMSESQLERLFKSTSKSNEDVTDYSVMNTGRRQEIGNNEELELMVPDDVK